MAKRRIVDILERLHQRPIVRTFAVDRKAVDAEARTVQLAFASDKPVDQWFGKLKLSMQKAAMRTDRIQSGAPLLMDHNHRDQVGVVESIAIDRSSGIARAVVRFSESSRAAEIFRDVETGIRKSISVGFLVHDLKLEDRENDIYRSDDWEPYEISIVSVPADISVGIGRSRSFGGKKTKMENDENEDQRLNEAEEIIGFARIFGEEPLAREMLLASSAVTVDDVRQAIRARQPATVPGPIESAASIAARTGGPRVELARSVPRHSVRNFTGEDAAEKAHRFGQWVLGGPGGKAHARRWCIERGLIDRAMSEGVNEKGGYLVPEEFGNDLIVLIEKYGVFRRNAKVRPMASDTRSDPLLTSELEAEFVGESTAGTDQDLTYSRVSLVARKIIFTVPFSSELNEDSSISIGDELAGAAARACAKKEDECGFMGDATSPYGGMSGCVTNLKAVSGTIGSIQGLQVGSGNAYSELALVDFEGVVGRLPEYADENAKWFVSKRFYWNVMVKLLLASGSGVTATEIEDARRKVFLGYPVEFAQVMPSTEANSQVCALLADLSMGALFGDRRSMRIAISDQVRFREDDLVFKATERFDVNSSFGVGDTTNAGPIVGLITAAS